ncbi:Phytocyanin domain [Sesbania bispinosa]|nr:Phytocyanin domain [Sesbania bispinosa]
MAGPPTVSYLLLLFLLFGFSSAREILVGGKPDSWKIPSSESGSLNQWAERSRFLIGDYLVWKYDGGKDSVLQVSKEGYANCSTSNPIKEYNDGNQRRSCWQGRGHLDFKSLRSSNLKRSLSQLAKRMTNLFSTSKRSCKPFLTRTETIGRSDELAPVKILNTKAVRDYVSDLNKSIDVESDSETKLSRNKFRISTISIAESQTSKNVCGLDRCIWISSKLKEINDDFSNFPSEALDVFHEMNLANEKPNSVTLVAERFIVVVDESSKPPLKMGFFINYNVDDILRQANESTLRYQIGEPIFVLDGVLVAIKDEIDCLPYPTTRGTKWLHKQRPYIDDACCVEHLRLCGAILVEKANMHELGAGTSGINPHYGATRNRYDTNRIAGGSSSGSTFVVSAGLCPDALGVNGGVAMVGILAGTVEDALITYSATKAHVVGWPPIRSFRKNSLITASKNVEEVDGKMGKQIAKALTADMFEKMLMKNFLDKLLAFKGPYDNGIVAVCSAE